MTSYRYRAFISYRHVERDRRWARWLIDRLETFRTPSALVKRGVPPRIGQLFRDDDEIPASGSLSRQIEDALRQSEFLIVVCSPRTPHSTWVRREIEMFQKLERHDRILALLTEGEPAEAFPPELLRVARARTDAEGSQTIEWEEAEPIAADVRGHPEESSHATEQRALMRIAATLLGVAYDDLAQREHHRQVQRRRTWAVGATVLLMAAGAAGYAWWDYNATHTRYYGDYGTRFGVPFGIGEISAEAAARRGVSYAIDTISGRTVEMRRENGSHGLVPLAGDGIDGEYWDAGVDMWRFPYPEARAVQIDVYGQKPGTFQRRDRELRVENFNWQPDGSAVVSFRNPSGGAATVQGGESRAKTALSGTGAPKSMVTLYRLQFTREGYVGRRIFQTVWGAESRDAEGRFGRSYSYTPDGRTSVLRNVDARAHVLPDRQGIAELRRKYGFDGALVSVEWCGNHGQPVANSRGYAFLRIRADANGNPLETTYFDERKMPVLRRDGGFARIVRAFDNRGNRIRETYYGVNGNPLSRQDNGVAQQRLTYDARGNIVSQRYFAPDGKPILRSDLAIAAVNSQYDHAGNVVEQRYFGLDGRPSALRDMAIARLTYRYDARGNDLEDRYFDADGKPVLLKGQQIAGSSQDYDERDNLIEQHYFGLEGKPALRAGVEFWRLALKYDERGNEIEEAYFGVDGKPVARADFGFARETLKYDDRGNEIEENYFGADGRIVLRRDTGVARVAAQYDERGNEVEEAYFDAEGMPVINRHRSAAKLHFTYNDHGDLSRTDLYDIQGRLIAKPPAMAAVSHRTVHRNGSR